MRYLIDTNIFVYMATDGDLLCNKRWKTAKDMLNSIENDFNIKISHIKKEHLITYANLQVNGDIHKDPSDHLIIAHSITEKMPLISSDRRFPYYTDQGLDLIFNER